MNFQLANLGVNTQSRQESMRCLVACLAGLIKAAARHSSSRAQSPAPPGRLDDSNIAVTNNSAVDSRISQERVASVGSVGGGRRNLISPETWQETLAIMCESDYGLRADYARALALFITSELPAEVVSDSTTGSKLKAEYSTSDETVRLLNALTATVFTLAVAPALGLNATSSLSASSSDEPSDMSNESSSYAPSSSVSDSNRDDASTTTVQLNIIDVTPVQSPITETSGAASYMVGQKASIASSSHRGTHRSRAASLALSLIDTSTTSGSPSRLQSLPPSAPSSLSSPACPSDYSAIVAVISSAIQRTPGKAIIATVPMLLALDKVASAKLDDKDVTDSTLCERRRAIRETVAQIWAVIASVVDSPDLLALAEKVSSGLLEQSSKLHTHSLLIM